MATATPTRPAPMEYPFAPSPDVLRTHQKDAYITSTLSADASSILRSLLGARFAHRHAAATNHLNELLYLCLTTLLGNRTLGEEYCGVLQIESDTLRLAGLTRRLGYICSVVFAPWFLSRSLPALRRKLRAKLERNIERAKHKTRSIRLQEYTLQHIDSLTSLNSVYALSLATFYFTGSYYHLSKRLFALRYIFTKRIPPGEQRVGYEVLGVLLVLQMAVQSTLHIRSTFFNREIPTNTTSFRAEGDRPQPPTTAIIPNGAELSLTTSESPDSVLGSIPAPQHTSTSISRTTSTPILSHPRYDLSDPDVMAWITERKCTLCLEPFKDPSSTTCGHVFCWTCVQDWVREKAECPLCRQAVLSQKILVLRE